jgi:hypothetical protein
LPVRVCDCCDVLPSPGHAQIGCDGAEPCPFCANSNECFECALQRRQQPIGGKSEELAQPESDPFIAWAGQERHSDEPAHGGRIP